MRIPSFLVTALVLFAGPIVAHAAESWPASSGTDISSSLHARTQLSGSAFEPSDAVVTDDALLLVSDEGDVATMNFDGGNVATWLTWAGNDQEGVTIVDGVMYVLNERYRDVYAYDLASQALLRTYDLSPWISGFDNDGPEALVYHEGRWLVGHSVTEEILAFDFSGDTPVFLESWASGLHVRALHSGEDGKLYVMSSGRVAAFSDDGSMVDYSLPSGPSGPEGFALAMDCANGTATAFIAYDSGPVYRYENFPVSCPVTVTPEPEPTPAPVDADADGVIADFDCNDADAAVSSLQTYYRDADGDTLGSSTDSTAVCSASAPSGYVTNTSDLDDTEAYFLAVGASYGAITVTYGDGSTVTYPVFYMPNTRKVTTVSVYKESQYLVVISAGGKRVAVVDAYSGAVLGLRAMPWRTGVLDAWLMSVLGF